MNHTQQPPTDNTKPEALHTDKNPHPLPPSMKAGKSALRHLIEVYKKDLACTFCQGWGHHAKDCSTLRKINRVAKSSATLKGVWGSVKAAHLTKHIGKRILEGALRRERENSSARKRDPSFSFGTYTETPDASDHDSQHQSQAEEDDDEEKEQAPTKRTYPKAAVQKQAELFSYYGGRKTAHSGMTPGMQDLNLGGSHPHDKVTGMNDDASMDDEDLGDTRNERLPSREARASKEE